MADTNQLSEKDLKLHLEYRSNIGTLLAQNQNFFGTEINSKIKPAFLLKYNTAFEELGCIGYQPVMEELTATIKVKRPNGYGGVLCGNGSIEYVRFFLDYGDGVWIDMGMTAVNVHDIPDSKDCSGQLEKPLSYVVRLKIDPKRFTCAKPNLPRLRAVLSWNSTLPPNQPFPAVAWGDAKEARIQIRPLFIVHPRFPLSEIGDLLVKAIENPTISLASLAATTIKGDEKLALATEAIKAQTTELPDLVRAYAASKLKVEPERAGLHLLTQSITAKDALVTEQNSLIFTQAGLDWKAAFQGLIGLKGNTSYEELFCVGTDYHKEALVATLRVKKTGGYSGDLCNGGSKEYVGFWIQEKPDCQWVYAGTSFVNSYDIQMNADGLSYSVILPHSFEKYRKPCSSPVVLKVRGVLSWNSAPSTTDPDQVPYWGNIIDSYVQIMPGRGWDGKSPVIITVGGVSVDNIQPGSGLTKPGAVLEFNQAAVYAGSPFGGTIVVQGLSDPMAGMKYRVKVRNLNTGGEYYVNGGLQLLGYNTATNTITHPVIYPDNSVTNYYTYQSYLNNIDSVLARFNPGTNDLLEITVEMENGASVSQRIQMDNDGPKATLTIDKPGCGGYSKGEHITGKFSASDAYLLSYYLQSSLAPNVYSGVSNIANASFDFATTVSNACGNISLAVYEKTIWNSAWTGNHVVIQEIVCLK